MRSCAFLKAMVWFGDLVLKQKGRRLYLAGLDVDGYIPSFFSRTFYPQNDTLLFLCLILSVRCLSPVTDPSFSLY